MWRNQKNKSAADDIDDDKSGHVYPRLWGLLSNQQSTKIKLRTKKYKCKEIKQEQKLLNTSASQNKGITNNFSQKKILRYLKNFCSALKLLRRGHLAIFHYLKKT